MQYLIAAFIFIITLGFSLYSTASQPDSKCSVTNEAPACAPKDHTITMNSLFPEKQPLTKLTTRPTRVVLSSPKFLAKVTGAVKLEWTGVPGANTYHVQIATDPNFKWLVADEHFIKETSFEFAKTEARNKYFWRVAAFNTDNESMFTKSIFVDSIFITQ